MINLSRVASQLEQLIRELPAEPVRLLCESLRVSAYKHALAPPPPNTRPVQRDFSATFGEVASWLTALSEGYAAAVEVGLDVLAALHPRKGKTIAVAILHEGGWRELAVRACILLSKLDDEAAFGAILNVLDTTPRAGFLLAQSPYANGCASVLVRFRAVELSETSRAHMLSYLGARGCSDARGLLVERLASSPGRKERLAAGHALLALGDNDSLDSLAAELASPEPILRLLAARAAISLDPKTVVDRIGEERLRQQDASGIAEALFKALRDQIKGDGPYWHRADPGWDALFAHWAGTKGPVGGLAQQLLQISDGAPPTLPVDVRVVTTTSSLSPGARLKRWQRDGVAAWAEIRELDPLVRDAEAVQVLRELMARARQRIERVVERLDAIGYRFLWPDAKFAPPPPNVDEQLAELEARVGVLPLSVRAAFETFGSCNLMGSHPAWPRHGCLRLSDSAQGAEPWITDPLVLPPLSLIIEDSLDYQSGSFEVVLSGDELMKAGVSGGQYAIAVPNAAVDARLDGDAQARWFVDHLLEALNHGGFAGFSRLSDAPHDMLNALQHGLDPM